MTFMRCLGAFLLLLIAGSIGYAAQKPFTVEGRAVVVRTERYEMTVEGLEVVRVVNRLTGERYASPRQSPSPSASLQQQQRESGVAVESLRPNEPDRFYQVVAQTRVDVRADDHSATIQLTGLSCDPNRPEAFFPDMTAMLTLRMDDATGDLLLTQQVRSGIEPVHDIRDRGLKSVTLRWLGLDGALRLIAPTDVGVAYEEPADSTLFTTDMPRWLWPMGWQAGLVILESGKGSMAMWADEPALDYSRAMTLARSQATWTIGLEWLTSDRVERNQTIDNVTWRFNVFAGDWLEPAGRYVKQMKSQWGMKPISERSPKWAEKVRIVLGSSMPSPAHAAKYADIAPRDTMAVFTSQGWLKGWNQGEPKYETPWPNWPFDNPVRYEGVDGIGDQFAAIEKLGIHVFPYTNATCVGWGSKKLPWFEQRLHARTHLAWRIWQRFYVDLAHDIVSRYGTSGIYEDCSWVVDRHFDGKPDGDNWAQGSVHMREYFHQTMPDVAMMGERNHEVTARGQNFALIWIERPNPRRHPICGRLFNEFISVWNLAQNVYSCDDDDIRGALVTHWSPGFNADPLQEEWMLRQRGLIFANEQLVSHWPDRWDPTVMHYFTGKDGTEYRFVRDRGTRFIKLRSNGSPETLYWRLHGERQIEAPGLGIEGWLAYDGDRIVGLNPEAPMYVVGENIHRPPAVIASVPEGMAVLRHVVRDGYWIAQVGPVDIQIPPPMDSPAKLDAEAVKQAPGNLITEAAPNKADETKPATRIGQVIVKASLPIHVLGATSVAEQGSNQRDVGINLPGTIVVAWDQPITVTPGASLLDLPTTYSVHDRKTGLVYQRGQPRKQGPTLDHYIGNPPAQEGVMCWLLQLPKEPVKLSFDYGTLHGYGDGAEYCVRVNGGEIWQAYRTQEVSSDPEKAKDHIALPIESAVVDLTPYAGQMISLELAVNGHQWGGSETMSWGGLRFEPVK
ncbi:MAG: hypothetical protein IT440_11310 [Phycisphaeraceae bacterium]|nr:hypothetical protein [Phycisphaeraceae bacterium]